MHGYQFDAILRFIHIDTINLLQARLNITIYNQEIDQAFVWAYLRGIEDSVLQKEEDDKCIRMVFLPKVVQQTSLSPIRPSSPIIQVKKKKVSSVGQARAEAKKKTKENVACRFRELRSKNLKGK